MGGYHTDDLELASDFSPLPGEANFGPTITREVVGGTHIAPQCITINEQTQYVLVDWFEGLPRHDKPGTRRIRFPHGLIHFGESPEDCAIRLVRDQLGMAVIKVTVCHIFSVLDATNHWHLEPLLITRVTGTPSPPKTAAAIYFPAGPQTPDGFRWIGKPAFEKVFQDFIKPHV